MKVCVITGCSSGFGRISARYFAENEYTVYATVRRPVDAAAIEKYAAERGLALYPHIVDVRDRTGLRACIGAILRQSGRIDVLINNAGVATAGALEDMPDAGIDNIIGVNLLAPLTLSRCVLPAMREQGGGHIIMVSSLSALVGLPGDSLYCASKAALEAAAEGLRHEVDRFGIHVSVIEPGLFNTDMPAKIAAGACCPSGSVYAPLIQYLSAILKQRLGTGDDPHAVAELLLQIANDDKPRFRYAAGDQAKTICNRIEALTFADRDGFIRAVHDTAWWSHGKEPPAD